jgi:hypothetical protein
MVTGVVQNEGASVEIFGMVGSVRDVDPMRPAVIAPGAMIGPR